MKNTCTLRSLGLLLACAVTAIGCAEPVPMGGPLATGQKGVTSIAVDDFYLYMTIADGSIKRVSLDGGPVITIAEGQHNPGLITVDADHVYWTMTGGIARAPKAGGVVAMVHESPDEIGGLTVDEANVYFTATTAGEVRSVAKAGAPAVTLASKQSSPRVMRGLTGGIYWGNAAGTGGDGAVMALSLASAAAGPSALVPAQNPTALHVSTTHLYWRNASGSVAWSELGGGEVHEVGTGLDALGAVVGDEANVYWAGLDGSVKMAPMVGGAPQVVVSGPGGQGISLAMDMASIYWANPIDGAVMTMPKF